MKTMIGSYRLNIMFNVPIESSKRLKITTLHYYIEFELRLLNLYMKNEIVFRSIME